MRELVQAPMNTLSGRMSMIGVLGLRSMYLSARSIHSRCTGSFSCAGSGTLPSTVVTICGLVPQVTCGRIFAASSVTTLSNLAPGSLTSVRQYATALSQFAPLGASGRPLTYSTVLSSTATMPARAPASIDMLHRVMRPSIESERIASPVNSMV